MVMTEIAVIKATAAAVVPKASSVAAALATAAMAATLASGRLESVGANHPAKFIRVVVQYKDATG